MAKDKKKETAEEIVEETVEAAEPTLEEKITVAKKHLNLAVSEHGEYVAVREMRKHLGWYLKGLKGSAKVRDEINKITGENVTDDIINEIFSKFCLGK